MIYTALDEAAALAELAKTASSTGFPLAGLRNRSLAVIRVDFSRVLDLTDSTALAALGVQPGDLIGEDVTIPRAIGAAAHAAGFEAILAPSAAGVGSVLAIFGSNRAPSSVLDVVRDEQLPP